MLHDELSWYHLQRDKIYSLCKSIKGFNNKSYDDIKSDFYLHIIDKNINNKSGLIIAFINYLINIYNKNKKKNHTYKFDKHVYEEYYDTKFDKFNLSIDEKRYLAFFNARYIKEISGIRPQYFGLYFLLKEKGLSQNENIKRNSQKKYQINRNKNIRFIMLMIIQLYHHMDKCKLTMHDDILILYCKDYFSGLHRTDRYLNKLDIFDNHGLRTKEHKIIHLCRELLKKIYKEI